MIAHNPNLLCQEAEQYHYNFLFEQGREPIPDSIVKHIKQCQNCQKKIHQLEDALSQAEDRIEAEQKQDASAIAFMLKLHFACIGKPITCQAVKPFLPGMSDPNLEIKIPTPITVHLDNCRQCSEDLETIRNFDLSRKQLCRLSQLFAEKTGKDSVSCSKARPAMFAVVNMAFKETTAEVLKHLCTCPDCRKELYEFRDTFRREYKEEQRYEIDRKAFPCEEVPVADIFDYVVPYGLDPTSDRYAKFHESLISHLRTCPTCLAKMQELHKTVYEIAERPESDIITVFHIDESAKTQAATESEDAYAGFPIKVEVASCKAQSGVVRAASAINLKRAVKIAGPVAAAIVIAAALLLNIPHAKAVTIDQIYKAIEKAKNVYIASYATEEKEPIQEKWVSRSLGIYMTKTGKELVLWDLANKVRKTKQLAANLLEATPLSDDLIVGIQKRITGSLGLMPFNDISDIPQDVEWNIVVDDVKATANGAKVYDLTWAEKKYGGSVVLRKWHVFASSDTNLPQRIEWYEKLTPDDEYILDRVISVKYLSDKEMQAVITQH